MKGLKVVVAGLIMFSGAVHAQSESVSAASELSTTASVNAASAVLALVPAGSELVITLVRPVGELIEVTFESAATGASFVLTVAATAVEGVALSTGAVIEVVATGAGWLLESAGKAVAFVPNQMSQSLTHRQQVKP